MVLVHSALLLVKKLRLMLAEFLLFLEDRPLFFIGVKLHIVCC